MIYSLLFQFFLLCFNIALFTARMLGKQCNTAVLWRRHLGLCLALLFEDDVLCPAKLLPVLAGDHSSEPRLCNSQHLQLHSPPTSSHLATSSALSLAWALTWHLPLCHAPRRTPPVHDAASLLLLIHRSVDQKHRHHWEPL